MKINRRIVATALSLGLIGGAGFVAAPAASAGSFAGSSRVFFANQQACEVWRTVTTVNYVVKNNGVRVSESSCTYDPDAQRGYTTGKPWVGYVGLWRD